MIPFDFEPFVLNPSRNRDRSIMEELRAIRRENRLAGYPQYADDPIFVQSEIDIAYGRYNGCMSHFVPWLYRHHGFSRLEQIVEIGAGTGSSTAAFARISEQITGYDIDRNSLDFAEIRLKKLEITNASLVCVDADRMLEAISATKGPVDGVIMYAVLEHLTIEERLELLRVAWKLLRPGGVLLVGETPNRLAYSDHHTSGLPFFNMLPEELALKCYRESDRTHFTHVIGEALDKGDESAHLALVRSGYSGASFHEFELALGEGYADYIVSNPDDPEILNVYGDFSIETDVLKRYVRNRGLEIHPCFLEMYLLMVLRKPA